MNAPLGPVAKLDAHIWERHDEDWYVEPEWVSERLFEQESFRGPVYDPACGSGRIVSSALAAGLEAHGTDLVNRSRFCDFEQDFLTDVNQYESIVSNPPFSIADKFVTHAIEHANKVAMILPAKWHVADKRSRWLETTPLYKVLAITPRPSMPPGALIEGGMKPGGGKNDFSWYIWMRGYSGPWRGGWLRRDA